MKSKVAIVNKDSFAQAIEQLGGLEELNTPNRKVVIKVGIYNPETKICTTPKTLEAMIEAFDKTTDILVVESDSGAGPGLKRLEIWNECYSGKVVPFNLSDDPDTKEFDVAGESVPLSHVLFKPNILVSTHVPRRYENTGDEDLMNLGSIIKNLLGLVPDVKKFRFHNRLPKALLDMYEAVGGLNLAVLDGTKVYLGKEERRTIVTPEVLLVGKDAFAVEAVGAYMVGFDPLEMPVLLEAQKRGLGEINPKKIEIIGDLETPKKMVLQAFAEL